MRRTVTTLFAALALTLTVTANGQDYAREKRWADEITPAILVGDPIYIELTDEPGRGHKFLSILAEGKTKDVAFVVVHGVGVHPDHSFVGALRTKLNDRGYTTLSIQLPVAKGEGAGVDDYYPALFPQAGNRIASAARFLQVKGYKRVVLASHSMGAWMANVYLANTLEPPFAAWIPMGLTGRYWGASLISIPFLGIEWLPGKIRMPVLDVYGENDIEPVRGGAKSRRAALDHIPRSAQIVIPGADHQYAGREDAVVDAIHKFIEGLK
ncbi:MAG: hypothetical protein ABIU95_05185 [Burkholderiales bacterium]